VWFRTAYLYCRAASGNSGIPRRSPLILPVVTGTPSAGILLLGTLFLDGGAGMGSRTDAPSPKAPLRGVRHRWRELRRRPC
jgi:hypothetical protein